MSVATYFAHNRIELLVLLFGLRLHPLHCSQLSGCKHALLLAQVMCAQIISAQTFGHTQRTVSAQRRSAHHTTHIITAQHNTAQHNTAHTIPQHSTSHNIPSHHSAKESNPKESDRGKGAEGQRAEEQRGRSTVGTRAYTSDTSNSSSYDYTTAAHYSAVHTLHKCWRSALAPPLHYHYHPSPHHCSLLHHHHHIYSHAFQ